MSDNNIQNGTRLGCRFRLASVYILSAPYHLDKPFDYRIPDALKLSAGDFAAVPFGGGNRPETALVFQVRETDEADISRYKPISAVLPSVLSLSDEALRTVEFLKEHTFCTTGDAVRTITPSSAFSKLEEFLTCLLPLPDYYPELSAEYQVYDFISKSPVCTKSRLYSVFGAKKAGKALSTLISEKIISSSISVRDITNIKYALLYSTPLTADDIIILAKERKLRSVKHAEILKYLSEKGISEQGELCEATGATSAQLKTLTEKGYITCEKRERYRLSQIGRREPSSLTLNEEQKKAADTIISLTRCGKPKAALLHGVTGSGKTHVIRAVMEEVIKSGRSVILLVPEISLTPQTISFFSASFGDRTAVIHSGLSAGERFDAWRRIKNGEVDVCIGTRSAVFAPFQRLGLIVIDEEQEHTYKSDSSPRYHAKEAAGFRCGYHNAVLLLASATPSLESYHKAMKGAYTLTELKGRFGSARIPKTEIIDMRTEAKEGNFSLFSARLIDELRDTIDRGKQSILFLNRRGYHSFVSCPICGKVFMCPHCSVSLTHHFSRFNENGYLCCHYCGYRSDVPEKCPECGSPKVRFMGYGTQLAEEQLQKLLPDAHILRMDADTTTGKFSYDDILGRFRRKEADILLGTQMVTKGHDFPSVTLVGVLSADQSLYVDDYRANERTFSLICQTVGRAGRGDEEGRALIQCYTPQHPVLALSGTQDYRAFYETEIPLRKSLVFPPFCDIAVLSVTAVSEEDAINASGKLFEQIKTLVGTGYKDVGLQVFGPFEAPVYKLNEKFRMRLVIKSRNGKRFRALFREVLSQFGAAMPKNVTASIDINPSTV